MKFSVLLDTSFFIRLLDNKSPLHSNALGYYKYFLKNEIALKISTISIAEFCVVDSIDNLPLKDLQILPFNVKQAEKTGQFARIIFNENKKDPQKLSPPGNYT